MNIQFIKKIYKIYNHKIQIFYASRPAIVKTKTNKMNFSIFENENNFSVAVVASYSAYRSIKY